ncbi:hormogonium polysaccharide biosynthesis protein HpsA [Microcoleus vaginatus]|uniref:hormogonium polysaccharide biosynthesis protein HpsA n=1 Tax=Microcoleus vaginatus TaxID=119532 RepID=UPI00403F53E1
MLAAATPALDRAKAKIQYLVGEGNLVTGTPSDRQLYLAMSSYPAAPTPTDPDLYTFGDEERLVLRADLSGNGISLNDDPKGSLFSAPGVENEALNTAWRYPVDTNNDGIFDTFTLYGIYFRTPKSVNPRPRKELDARTPPMRTGTTNPACAQGEGTVASLVGDSGWERISGRLQKSFFVYTVNVPITQTEANTLGAAKYQAFPGTPSISALEYQQDQSRIPLSNNAVVYEDDLDISPGPPLNLNGRILTNSNLLVSGLGGARNIRLFEVSSKQSCFYDQENSRIIVGGNVVNGWSGSNAPTNPVEVHLFKTLTDTNQPNTNAPTIDTANQSVAENSLQVLYNNNAYSERLAALVDGQIEADPTGTNDPVSVQQARLAPKSQSREQALQDYFKERLRKVTFAEAPLASAVNGKYLDPNVPTTSYRIQDAGNNSLRPANPSWSLPNGTATVGAPSGAGLTIRPTQLPAEDPEELELTESEDFLGNRVTVGNNLPALRWDGTSFTNDPQQVDGTTKWANNGPVRTRTPQVTKLADVGATARGNGLGEAPGNPNSFSDGFWEKSAAERPRSPLDGVGGLRVITSAGVYDRTNSFLPPPTWIQPAAAAGDARLKSGPASRGTAFTALNTYDDPETPAVEQYRVVWPDSMPMSPLGPGSQVWNNGNVAAGAIAPGAWGKWDPTWSPAAIAPALPDATVLPAAETNPNFVVEQATTARKFAKGDLRMRATAVYHYANNAFDPVALAPGAQPTQTPLACVSSYYDPQQRFHSEKHLDGSAARCQWTGRERTRGRNTPSNTGKTAGFYWL